jgi:NAD(P)-dependent dehydrogenase (short-subunit alcohol dehydrogenase family)
MGNEMQSLFDLTGQVALVTGASSGIGRAIAIALGGAGAKVVLAARREGQLREAVAEVEARGTHAAWVKSDLCDANAAVALAAAAKKPFGPPTILVNSAGVNLRQPINDVTPETWEQTLALNLSVPFFLSRALVGEMRAKRYGRIINITSLQSVRAFANSAPYGASKGGLCQLTRAMAEAWSKDGVMCNAIAPGFFPTELTAPVFADANKVQKLAEQTAVGRNGTLQDLWGAAIFLASPASAFVTGQTLFVDGGFSAK